MPRLTWREKIVKQSRRRNNRKGTTGEPSTLASRGLVPTREEALVIASEIDEAFTTLLAHNPTLVRRFEEAFHYRSTLAGVVESRTGIQGIEGMLEGNLGSLFEIKPVRSDDDREMPDEAFVAEFREALMLLTEKTPFVLALLRRNLQRQRYSLEEFLQAMFIRYVECKTVLPY